MQNEPTEFSSSSGEPDVLVNDTPPDVDTPRLETEDDEELQTSERPLNQISQMAQASNVGVMSTITGAHATAYSISHHYGVPGEREPCLDSLISFSRLESPQRTYQSIDPATLIQYSHDLPAERILLLSCHDESVALHVAQTIAYQTDIPNKEQVSIDETGHTQYIFRNFINSLGRPTQSRIPSKSRPIAICVWDAAGTNEIASGILDSLLSRETLIAQYKYWLSERGLCLICIVSPHRVNEYRDAHSGSLRCLEIDFLTPLLEHYNISDHETLADEIRRQRQRADDSWSNDDVAFYRQIIRHLKAGNLSQAVLTNSQPVATGTIDVDDLFTRQDPLTDTVLYCATYFPDLSPQDFFYLVELFLGETTEDITRRVTRPVEGNGNEVVEVVESVPLVNRWRREAHIMLRRCKLAAVTNADDMRVIEFQTESFRQRLSQFIPEFDPYFYEANFVFLRQQGLLFSPKTAIAKGARKLLVEIGKQCQANEVANWLYEFVIEFNEMAQAADRLAEVAPVFQLLPDSKVKTARRYVAYALSRVLIRCDKEPKLREALRLFWQKLLHHQHQWFLDLLRRMGDAVPAESLKWLKQLLDQGTELVRRQVRSYLVAYLLHQDSIYSALKQLMEWPRSTPAGRIARQALIFYCAETNRQVAPQDYGQWPSLHPLFGFQNRAEAEECLDLLVGWTYGAASEVDVENALYIVADIVAGWYFILSSAADDDSSQVGDEVASHSELNTRIVKDLLFECLMRHGLRANALPEIWDRFKNDILDKIINLETFINETSKFSSNAEVVGDATKARRNLLETREALSELRHAYIEWIAHAAPA